MDFIEEAGTKGPFERSLELIRTGLVVGPSSGFALQGLLRFLDKKKQENALDRYAAKTAR